VNNERKINPIIDEISEPGGHCVRENDERSH
jgi:hypothetical protein